MVPIIHTASIILAVEDKVEVLLMVHHPDVEATMETMEANPKETTNSKMVQNQPAGSATFSDIIMKTAANVSVRMLPAMVSMDEEKSNIQ
jgi:hypothetical protein